MPVSASLPSPAERARKAAACVLKRLATPGAAVATSVAMGVSEATISRLKNEHLEPFALMLAHLGLKVVPVEQICVAPDTYHSLAHIAAKAMSHPNVMQQLVWDDPE